MKTLNIFYRILLCVMWTLLAYDPYVAASSVEIKCIPIKSCPTIMQMLYTKKQSPEMVEFLRFSHCGYDEWRQPKVWCSVLNFCKTPDGINGKFRASFPTANGNLLVVALPQGGLYKKRIVEYTGPQQKVCGAGTCTPIKKCKPYLELAASLNILDPRTHYYLDQFRCNTALEGIHVCCPTEPRPNLYMGDFITPHGPYKSPLVPRMSDRFDFSYEDYDYGMLGDDPDTYYHHDHHSHDNVDPHRSWHNGNDHHVDDSNKHVYNHQHNPEFHHFHNHNNEVDNHHHKNNNDISSEEKTHNRNHLPDNNNKRRTDVFSHETTEHQNHGHTTERNEWSGRRETTQMNNHGNVGQTTPKTSSTTKSYTPRGEVGTRDEDDAIIFMDSMEDFTTAKPKTTAPTTARSQTRENNNGGDGKSCQTPDKKIGSCVREKLCERYRKLQNTLDKSKKSDRDYLSKFRCNKTNTRETYVCCQKDEEDDTIDNSVIHHERSNENIPEPDSKVCGRARENTNKIVGGSLADLAEFPWMALLRYSSSKGMQFGCGGTLISNRHVLTAAHCVDEKILKSKGLEKLTEIVLGEYDTRNETDCIYMDFGEDCADPPKTFGVESIKSHNLYSSETTRNDIALIKLNREVRFTDFISPICLPTKRSKLNGNETFFIAGWGRTPTEPTSPILKKAKIPYVPKRNCDSLAPSNRKLIEGQICAGFGNGTDSCSGDSGGPLMFNVNVDFESVAHIYGIISYGFGRCVSGPSVNTFVPFYVDWIKENMK